MLSDKLILQPKCLSPVANLLDYLNSHIDLTDVFVEKIGPTLEATPITSTQLIVEKGGRCDTAFWIDSGYGRIFYNVKNIDGFDEEITIDFCRPKRILVVGECFFNELPCNYNIEICNGSVVVPFTRNNFDVLKLVSGEAKVLATKILALEKPDALEKMEMLKMKPRDRYHEFLRIFGVEIELFFQVQQIASYLGMRPSYLSRLRGEIKTSNFRRYENISR